MKGPPGRGLAFLAISSAHLIFLGLFSLSLCLCGWSSSQEKKLDDTEYDKSYAKVVKAYETAEKASPDDPAGALKTLERDVLPNLPKLVEVTLVVQYSRGITRGEEKERHDFYPYRLAGRCAMAGGQAERAVAFFLKSPSSAESLAEARRALAEKQKVAPPPLQKPEVNLTAFLERHDFVGALAALKAERSQLGPEHDRRAAQVRDEAVRHQKAAVAAVAQVLPRLEEEGFLKDHVEPCLAACARVPSDLEIEELRWVRKLAEWTQKRTADELDRLALAAARFDPAFHALCERAQEGRLREIERLVEAVNQAPRAERQGLLEQIEAADRAFAQLSAAKEYRELRDTRSRLKARLPIDDKALEQARGGAVSIKEIRVMADQLDRLWGSDRRLKLGVHDQNDLALYLGLYRCYALFLDGKSIEDVARDPRVIEVFRTPQALPKDVSPKVARVQELVQQSK